MTLTWSRGGVPLIQSRSFSYEGGGHAAAPLTGNWRRYLFNIFVKHGRGTGGRVHAAAPGCHPGPHDL
eukprot:764232-Prymnesium_polylepis.1